MRKNLLLLLFCVLMSLPALARDFGYTYEGQRIAYTVIDEEAKTCITREGRYNNNKYYSGNIISGDVVLPANPKDGDIEYTLVGIGKIAFSGCSGLTSIKIPNSVNSIGSDAFFGCSGLTSIEIPNSVTSIGSGAFWSCSGLTSIELSNSLTTIGSEAFYSCSGLTSIEIPNSVTSIGLYAFEKCNSLKKAEFASIEALCNIAFESYSSNPLYEANHLWINGQEIIDLKIPDTVTKIRDFAFISCSGLKSVLIPSSVTSIGRQAFHECRGLIKTAYPYTLESPFEDGTFYTKSVVIKYDPEGAIIEDGFVYGREKSAIYFAPLSLEGDFSIPESVTSITYGAFYSCSGLKSVEIPNPVASIGDKAFMDCSGLTSVEIGNSVTSIGDQAFLGCSGLTLLVFNAENCLSNGTEYRSLFSNTLKTLVIGEKVKRIPNYAFIGCIDLTEVIIPDSVSEIGEYAFWACQGMTSVTIGESVSKIGKSAFLACTALTNVRIPNSVTAIGEYAFQKCKALTSVEINNSEVAIGNYAFSKCDVLASVKLGNSTISIGKSAFWDSPAFTSIEIPNSVKFIDQNAFKGCSALMSVKAMSIQPAVMNGEAFNGLYETAVLSVPDSAIENYLASSWSLFKNMRTNTGAELGYYSDGVLEYRLNPEDQTATIIGAKSYDNLQIPERFTDDSDAANPVRYNIKGIEYKAFYNKGVNNVEFNSRSKMEFIGDYAFKGTNIASVNIPSTVTAIGNYAFNQCSSLKEAPLPDGLETLGDGCFANSGLRDISIPGSVKTIGESAFSGCGSLYNVSLAEGIEQIKANAFESSGIDAIRIPSSVIEISEKAFYNTIRLRQVELQEGLQVIGAEAFSAETGAYRRRFSLFMPSSVSTIGGDAFANCEILTVEISDISAWLNIDFGNVNANPLNANPLQWIGSWDDYGRFYINGEEVNTLSIPEGIEEIKRYAFTGSHSLKEVTFPNGLKSIGNYAFDGCLEVKAVTIPASVDMIGKNVFSATTVTFEDGLSPIDIHAKSFYNGVTNLTWGRPLESLTFDVNNLTDLSIRSLVEEIPEGIFNGCSKLQNLSFGSAVKVVGANSFNGCTKLQRLMFGSEVNTIGDGAFSGCKNLADVKFGSNIATIGANAFSKCTSLTEVVLPPAVETIGAEAFAGNSNMASIIMGHNVKTIGEKAFDGCPAKTVSITAQTPPTAPNNTFSVYSGKLYLQGEKAVEAYYDAFTCWDRFSSFVMIDAEKIQIEGADKISGKAGDTFQLTATVWPENVTLPQVFWRSTNPDIATVDANGLVTLHVDLESLKTRAQGEGDIEGLCTIIAETLYNDGPIAQIGVTAEDNTPILVNSLTIDPTTWSGEEGSEFTITATVLPEDATDKSLTWTSSDETVATVDSEGNVKVLKEGNCTITVATTDGSNLTAECVITSVAGVEAIFGEDAVVDVYDMNGVLVKRACAREELKNQLTPGVYILRSGNDTVKAVIR